MTGATASGLMLNKYMLIKVRCLTCAPDGLELVGMIYKILTLRVMQIRPGYSGLHCSECLRTKKEAPFLRPDKFNLAFQKLSVSCWDLWQCRTNTYFFLFIAVEYFIQINLIFMQRSMKLIIWFHPDYLVKPDPPRGLRQWSERKEENDSSN